MFNVFTWIKARLNEPSTHAAILGLLNAVLLVWFVVPSKDQALILAAAAVLGGLGFALPEGLAKKVQQAESSITQPK
jgi:hypothetical protein